MIEHPSYRPSESTSTPAAPGVPSLYRRGGLGGRGLLKGVLPGVADVSTFLGPSAPCPPAGVTCVSPAVKALLAEGSGPEAVVKVERPQRSEDERP